MKIYKVKVLALATVFMVAFAPALAQDDIETPGQPSENSSHEWPGEDKERVYDGKINYPETNFSSGQIGQLQDRIYRLEEQVKRLTDRVRELEERNNVSYSPPEEVEEWPGESRDENSSWEPDRPNSAEPPRDSDRSKEPSENSSDDSNKPGFIGGVIGSIFG